MDVCADDVRDSIPLFRSGGGGSTPTSAHQLEIRKCKPSRAIELNQLWHSRLPHIHLSNIIRSTHYICFVAEFDSIAYASAIWSSPCARTFNGMGWLELRRLAIASDAPKNTATRMLRIMRLIVIKEFPEIVKLISYQDTEVHDGTIYKAGGWSRVDTNHRGDWQRPNRRRNVEQSLAPKVRWEYDI